MPELPPTLEKQLKAFYSLKTASEIPAASTAASQGVPPGLAQPRKHRNEYKTDRRMAELKGVKPSTDQVSALMIVSKQCF